MSDIDARTLYPNLPSDVDQDVAPEPSAEAKALYPSTDVPPSARRTWLDDPSRQPAEPEKPPRETWREPPRPLKPKADADDIDPEEADRAIAEYDRDNAEPGDQTAIEFDGEVLAGYREAAEELGISEPAQELLQRVGPKLAERQAAQAAAQVAKLEQQWATESRADPELAQDFDGSVAIAREVVQEFGGDGLVKLLNETGLGSHPSLLKTFAKIGRRLEQ